MIIFILEYWWIDKRREEGGGRREEGEGRREEGGWRLKVPGKKVWLFHFTHCRIP
jgi:hypothetical protein